MVMTTHKSNRPRVSLLVVLILAACIASFLLGAVAYHVIPFPWSTAQVNVTDNQELKIEADAVVLQLVNRVEDAVNFLQTTVAIMGVIVVLLGFALGLSIWQTREYADRLLDERFLSFREDKLEPILRKAEIQYENLANESIRTQLKASELILKDVFQVTQEMYHKDMEITGVTGERLAELVNQRREKFEKRIGVALYLVSSLSQNPRDVEDACQKLYHVAKSEAVQTQADSIVEHLEGLLPYWKSGSTREEIMRTISAVNRERG